MSHSTRSGGGVCFPTSVFGVEAVKEVRGGVAVAGHVVGAARALGRPRRAHAAGRLDVLLILDAVGLLVAVAAHAARVRGRAAVAAQMVRRVLAARRRRVSGTCGCSRWSLYLVSVGASSKIHTGRCVPW